ncbi:MAG: transglycosylase domain-containing protein [Clostridia bacterium]
MKKKKAKIILITLSAILIVCLLAIVVSIICVVGNKEYVKFDENKLINASKSLVIVDNSNSKINNPTNSGKKYVVLTELEDYTKNAFISIEDKRFYSHNGIDTKSILRAFLNNLISFSFKEGGSTISQQLIKNSHLSNTKTIKRKINEVLLSLQLEKHYSKNEILELYLNSIYFGKNAYGIERASKLYFNVPSNKLTLSQSATLAGIIKAPNQYSPLVDKEKCINRRNTVLATMLENKYIDKEQYQNALEENIEVATITNNDCYDCYVDGVIKQACDLLNMTPTQLENSELLIQTYLDEKISKDLADTIEKDEEKDIHGQEISKSAMLLDNKTRGIIGYFSNNEDFLYARKQIGSVAKPLAVYAPALDLNEISPKSPILDEPTNFNGYKPNNYANMYYGWTTVDKAIEKSLNIPAIKILNTIGTQKSREYLRKNGIKTTKQDDNLTLALGCISQGVNIIELTQSYATFANDGEFSNASFIKSISNKQGIIYTHTPSVKKVFNAETAFLMTNMLCDVAKYGTAKKINQPYQVACKTGTVSGNDNANSQAILCGYTTQHTFTVWLSKENLLTNQTMGSNQPTLIAKKILNKIYNDAPQNFEIPQNIQEVTIDLDELYKKHRLIQAHNLLDPKKTVKVFFSNKNLPDKPNYLQEKKNLIKAVYDGKNVTITTESENCYLYRVCEENKELLSQDCGRTFVDRNIECNKTYTYILCDVFDCQKANVTISIPANQKQKQEKNKVLDKILNSWYL